MCTRTIAQASQSLGLNMLNNPEPPFLSGISPATVEPLCVEHTELVLFRVLNESSQARGPGAELAACGQGWMLIQGFD